MLNRYWCNFLTKHLNKNMLVGANRNSTHSVVVEKDADHTISETVAKQKKPPFMQNIFAGIIDKDILIFPEVDNHEKENKNLVESLSKGSIKNQLKYLLKCNLPTTYGGVPSTFTQFLKCAESFKLDIIPSFIAQNQYSSVICSILKYGTENQKNIYLQNIIRYSKMGVMAYHEEETGFDVVNIKATAYPDYTSDSVSYKLNGEKTWITNAHLANFFVVFAQAVNDNRELETEELTAFIVDGNKEGISVTKQEIQGFDGCDFYRVKFSNVIVTSDCVLGNIAEGYNILNDCLESMNLILGASVITKLRQLCLDVTLHVAKTKRLTTLLMDHDLVKRRISEAVTALYALESSYYLVCGINDLYDINITLESIMLQELLYSHGIQAFKILISMFGTKVFEKSHPYSTLLSDLEILTHSTTSPHLLKQYIALKGIQHAGSILADNIKSARNPLNFPGAVLKNILKEHRHANDSPKLNHELYMQLHPSLKDSTNLLEYCILRFQYCVELILTRHGKDVINKQNDLCRISNVASEILSMVAVLARASRSYCTGIRYSDQEIVAAKIWCLEATNRVKNNVTLLLEGAESSNDAANLFLSKDIFQYKGYFFASPTEKNID